jgi:hypothetical protein
LEKGEKEKFG